MPLLWLYAGLGGFYLSLDCAVAWFGYWFMGGLWPGRPKLVLCSILGLIGVGLMMTLANRASKGVRDRPSSRTPLVMPPIHALGVLLLLAAESVFATWLIWWPR